MRLKMFFPKDYLAVTITCFTEKKMDWYSESARLLYMGHISRTCL